jgi:VWFA-related protein
VFRLKRHAPAKALLLMVALTISAVPLATAQPKPSAAPQDDDVLRVETDLTNILFTAIDKEKRFVTTLQRDDLRVLENNLPQEVFTFQRETDLPLSLVILIDTSKSQENTLDEEKAAARAFVASVIRPEKDQAAIISFTGTPTIEQSLTGDRASLREGIDRVTIKLPLGEDSGGRIATPQDIALEDTDPPIGSTAIWDALLFSVNDVLAHTRGRTRRAIILLSDGSDTYSRTKRAEAIDRAVKADVVIYSIGIGSDEYGIEKDTLRHVAQKSGGTAFFPENEALLSAAFKQLEEELRSQYLLAYTPSNGVRDGAFRKIRLEILNPELRKRKLRLLYRQGYYARANASR